MKKYFSLFLFIVPSVLFAQDNSRFAKFSPGQVICSTSGKIHEGELYSSAAVGDPYVIGVYSPSPLPKRNPVVTEGVVEVLIDESAGAVKKGDILTSGPNGKAVKMNGTGLALGIATADASGGKVPIRICITIIK